MMSLKLPSVATRQEVMFKKTDITAQRSSSVPRQRSTDHFGIEKDHKTKARYVARQLSQVESLPTQEERISPTILMNTLSQVIEEGSELLRNEPQNFEMTANAEINTMEKSGAGELDTNGNVNIFENEGFNVEKYREAFVGPQYQNGKIVRHSIAGKPEFLVNYQRRMTRQASFERDSSPVSRASNRNNNSQSMKSLQDLSPSRSPPKFIRSESKKSTFSKLTLPVFRKDTSKDVISRQELFDEINKLRDRQAMFYSNIDKQAQHMAFHDKLTYTREKRVLDKFGKVLQTWDKSTEAISSKIGRMKTESVITKSESFREKVELMEVLEISKSDEQKFRAAYWYMDLRKSKNEGKGTFMKDDFPLAFQTAIMDRPKSSVQIIRKIRSTKMNIEGTLPNKSSLISTGSLTDRLSNRTAQEYLSQRLNESAAFISQVKANGNGFEELELVGESQLNTEINALFSDQKYKKDKVPMLLVKNKPNGSVAAEEKEETYIESYDKRRLARNGSQILLSSRLP